MPRYLVYQWHNLQSVPLGKLREIAEAFEIATTGMTRTQIRDAIFEHERNYSPVPHPLIDLPVALGSR